MSDTPIFDAVVEFKRYSTEPPQLTFLNKKYWERRKKKAKALTDRVWKEICEDGTIAPR